MSVTSSQSQGPGKRLFVVVAALIAVNILAWFFYTQIDLTRDKRFTITAATRHMLQSLDRKAEILVFLDGDDLPAPFQKLSNSTADLLRRFRDISGNKISYRVIDPLGADTMAMQLLRQFGMTGVPVTMKEGKGGTSQKMIFPWALVTMEDAAGKPVSYPVFLQESGASGLLNRQILLQSEMLLEYNLANGIHQLQKKSRDKVRYLTGNGEELGAGIYAMTMALAQYYDIDTFNIGQAGVIPPDIKTLVINNPSRAFTEPEKFRIDQYVMNGGNVLWSLNMVTGTLDSLRSNGGRFNAMPVDLNLTDLLFRYGARVNSNVVEDAVNHIMIPLGNKRGGNQLFHWIYFPVLHAGSDHIIVRNLNGVLGRFVGSIDTNASEPGIRKTVLLSSGKYSRAEAAPLPVILESAIEEPNPAAFSQSGLMAAVLLEGQFTSAYAGRRPLDVAAMIDSLKLPVKEKAARPGKMIVTSDADIMSNELTEKNGPLDMGVFLFDPGMRYDNKTFLLNAMEYMNDPDNLLEARSKQFDNRILDPKVVEKERTQWQFVNIALPVILILVLGSAFTFIRKRKYA